MSTVAEIEKASARLSPKEAEECPEDQREMTPEFLASIERGKADLKKGRTRLIRP